MALSQENEMDRNLDDDSYEFVDSNEFNSCKPDHKEDLSAESKHQRNGIETSDLETTYVLDMDKKTEDTDDDSYVLVDKEQSYNGASDSEKDPCSESKPHKNRTESSDLETDVFAVDKKMDVTDGDPYECYCRSTDSEEDPSEESKCNWIETWSSHTDTEDFSEMYGRHEFKTVAYQKSDMKFEFPANIKLKEDMEIKDVVKDHVLPFLPAKSLVRFRTVSKQWDKWILNPFLAHRQSLCFRGISGFFRQDGRSPSFITLNRSAYGVPRPSLNFLPESIVIRSSCNGLLLCQGLNWETQYYICNPANKEWDVLPQPVNHYGFEQNVVLAFEPSLLNFKAHYQVICPFSPRDGEITYFEIYSSETKSWKCSDVDCIELVDSKLKGNGFYMKGVAYWETWSGEILAFDMKNDLCGVQALPSERTPDGMLSYIGGELCYIQANNEDGNACVIDIYGGMHMGLKQSIAVNLPCVRGVNGNCRVLACADSDFLLILVEGVVYAYHVGDGRAEVLGRAGYGWGTARYLPYVNSLVSLLCK